MREGDALQDDEMMVLIMNVKNVRKYSFSSVFLFMLNLKFVDYELRKIIGLLKMFMDVLRIQDNYVNFSSSVPTRDQSCASPRVMMDNRHDNNSRGVQDNDHTSSIRVKGEGVSERDRGSIIAGMEQTSCSEGLACINSTCHHHPTNSMSKNM